MPTNVTPEYAAAEKRYEEAQSQGEKIRALQEMISECPKHKGSEKLLAELRSRLARFKRQQEEEKKKRKGGYSIAVPKEGFQIVIIGFPNSGKSSLLKALTNADPLIASYPFTTKKPEVGMLEHGGAMLQMVEVPALVKGAADKQGELMSIVHASDAIIMVVANEDEENALKKELKLFEIKKPMIIVKKGEVPEKQFIFDYFKLIRVYTKEPGKEPEMNKPILMRNGSTIKQAAREIHKDFYRNLKYARVWGSSKFPGQRVEKEYKLRDKDIVEFHI